MVKMFNKNISLASFQEEKEKKANPKYIDAKDAFYVELSEPFATFLVQDHVNIWNEKSPACFPFKHHICDSRKHGVHILLKTVLHFHIFPPPVTSLEIHTHPPLPWSLTSISYKLLGQQSKMDVAHPSVSPKSFPLRTPEVNQSTHLGWAKTHSANIWAQAPRDLEGPAAGRASGSHQPGKLPGAKFIHPGSVTDRCSYSAFSTWLTPLCRMYIHFVGFCII